MVRKEVEGKLFMKVNCNIFKGLLWGINRITLHTLMHTNNALPVCEKNIPTCPYNVAEHSLM